MKTVIDSILELDAAAEKKIEEANAEKLKIISNAKAEEERIINEGIESSKSELDALMKAEQENANKRIAELEKEKQDKLSAMNNSFNEHSKEWSNEIFAAIIE